MSLLRGAGADRLMMAIFAAQPLAFGAWLPCIPQVKEALGLSPAELAICILGLPIGTLCMLPLAGRVVARLGVSAVLRWGFPLFLAMVLLPALAPSPVLLFLALAALGISMSVLELAMNIGADRVERRTGRLIMNTCHGWWSFGLMAGSMVGAALAGAEAPPILAVGAMALAVLPVALWLTRSLPPLPDTGPDTGPKAMAAKGRAALTDPAVIGVGLFVLGVAMTEGAMADWAMADWAPLYLRETFGMGPGAAGLGFTVFAALVMAGRFTGDRLKARLGALRLARACGVLSLAAMAVLILTPGAALAYPALAALGLGLSTGFPLAVSAAAALPGRPAERSVAAVTFIALFGFLIGPVAIGALAEAGGLRTGFLALLPVLALSLWCSRALRPPVPGRI